ncbi:MAG: glycosyltransferase, partial [Candidatus Roizmanbacteria bacterium]|nr:glycosyltransferase [Candidatus Roizmanbacteria bacterium]
LVIVGKKNYFMNRLEHLMKERMISDRIIFTGEISDTELVWLYMHARALVLPSLMEGFGLPALEAMKFSCSVIASDIPVFHEICKEAAFYFNPLRTDQLTALLHAVITESGKSEIQKKKDFGKKRAREFSWEKMVQQTISIYESCLGV